MKTLKKSLVLLLALAMAVSVFAFGASAVYTDDVDVADEYKEAIDVLTALGVLTGDGDGTLAPERTITRGEFAKILYVAYFGGNNAWTTADKYKGFANFNDVSSDDWYAGVIGYATYKGWILGYGDGNFGPEDPVLGVDAITMILRMMGINAYGELSDGDTYAMKAIDFATNLLMLENTDENGVDYSAPIARGAVFDILFYGSLVPSFVKNADETWSANIPGIPFELEGYEVGAPRVAYNHNDYDVIEDVVIADVPATDASLKTEEDDGSFTYEVEYVAVDAESATGTDIETNTEIGAEYVGKVVTLRTYEDVVVGMSLESVEVTATKDDVDVDAVPEANFTVTDGVLAYAVADIEEGETYYAILDKDGKVDSYVTKVVAEDTWKVATFKATENDDKEIVVTIEGEEMEVAGVDTKDATYVIAYDMKGVNVVSAQVLNPSAKVKVTSVTTKVTNKVPVVTSFVAGTSYDVYPADGVNGKVVNGVNVAAVTKGADVYVYTLDGKAVYASTTRMPADKEEEVTTAFDGFAVVVDAKAVVSGDFKDDEWTDSTATGTVYAKVKVVLDDGTEAMYNLPVTAKKDADSGVTTYYVADPTGANEDGIEIYKTSESKPSEHVDLTGTGKNVVAKDTVYAYDLTDGDIALYEVTGDPNDAIDTEDVNYAPVTVGAKIEVGETTIDGAFAADATFVAKDGDNYVAVDGSANMPGALPNTKATGVKVTVTAEDDSTETTVLVVFGSAFEKAATDTKNLVFVDKNEVTESEDADENPVYSYTAITADNQKITVTTSKKLDASGIYVLKSDNSLGAMEGGVATDANWNLNVPGYIYLNSKYVALSDVVIYGALEEGDTISYIVKDDVTLIYVSHDA